MHRVLEDLGIDYLLVNSTNEYLVEYSSLNENARYTLTGFSGSTGDALLTKDNIYLFVDGRYHIQAEKEAKEGVTVVKLKLGQTQDNEIRKLIDPEKTLGIVAKKVSQKRLEGFKGYEVKLLEQDPINNFTEPHSEPKDRTDCKPREFMPEKHTLITNLEEVTYLTGYRDFSKDYSSKIWAKLVVKGNDIFMFTDNIAYENYLRQFDGELIVDKSSVSAWDYSLIKNPTHKPSEVKLLKAVKTDEEIKAYQKAFKKTDKAVKAIREYIELNDNLSEFDIAERLKKEFLRYGAKSLSFKSIVAIDQNSALAHYSKNSKDVILREGGLVLIDCGAYYESGLATDITRVFVKGKPSELQKEVYTKVLKAFLNAFKLSSNKPRYKGAKTVEHNLTGYDVDKLAHRILDKSVESFTFSHGLGHGIGINVHEAPPALNQTEAAHTDIQDNMTFTIEPGLYNPEHFGVRLENSCYKKDGKIYSFVKMGYEGKLIDYSLLTPQEQKWLNEFEVL